jgi:hypothetical protein
MSGALSNTQLFNLAKKMNIPLVFADFKDQLKYEKLQHNKFYIVNMEDELDENGKENSGSHWVCFQSNKYPNGKVENIYMDSMGCVAPLEVQHFLGEKEVPYNKKNIQSILGDICGYYCLGFGHFINSFDGRTGDLYTDTNHFLDLFDDLDKSIDFEKNEYILKHFFRSSNPKERIPISVEKKITGGDTDSIHIPVGTNII